MSSNSKAKCGSGVFSILTAVLVILKLNPGGHFNTPVENWSWWIVLIYPIVEVIIIIILLALIFILNYSVKKD